MAETQQGTLGLGQRIAAFGRALTVAEVAHLFDISPQMVYKHARMGEIPNFRIGTSVRFDPRALTEWLGKQ